MHVAVKSAEHIDPEVIAMAEFLGRLLADECLQAAVPAVGSPVRVDSARLRESAARQECSA